MIKPVALCAGLLALVAFPAQRSTAQTSTFRSNVGLSLLAYPAGLIGQVRYARVISPKQMVAVLAGLNATDRRDWGKHDDETGDGAGAGIRWQYFAGDNAGGFFLGIQADLWFMNIDWMQDTGESGRTEITVFQPTAQAGYTYLPAQSPWLFEAAVSLGMEINIRTRGEPVGEGTILLLGVGAGYRF